MAGPYDLAPLGERQLSVRAGANAERVKLAQDLWDSVAENPNDVPVTPEQREELDRRLQSFEKDSTAGNSWEAIKRSLRGK